MAKAAAKKTSKKAEKKPKKTAPGKSLVEFLQGNELLHESGEGRKLVADFLASAAGTEFETRYLAEEANPKRKAQKARLLAELKGKKEFPEDWEDEQVLDAAVTLQNALAKTLEVELNVKSSEDALVESAAVPAARAATTCGELARESLAKLQQKMNEAVFFRHTHQAARLLLTALSLLVHQDGAASLSLTQEGIAVRNVLLLWEERSTFA